MAKTGEEPATTAEEINPPQNKPRQITAGEETSFVIKAKDLVVILSFFIYVGATVTAFIYASSDLNDLKASNEVIKKGIQDLNTKVETTNVKLDMLEKYWMGGNSRNPAKKANE